MTVILKINAVWTEREPSGCGIDRADDGSGWRLAKVAASYAACRDLGDEGGRKEA
ncbi:hypothetical protein [Neorhizobium sp. NCHU2750]|uniref:hypothetical protein n=1 Tax=Neorhizobium sp. NCHU2750 TaxID=1825976 RepID=UPI000EB619DE|nr:hypothetical protein NCHU2750_20790 [Neorhizobium sp. NCHU2750]